MGSPAGEHVLERAHLELARELGLRGPALSQAALQAQEIDVLTATLRAAKQRQHQQLARALQNALAHVPPVLRGPVRKILEP